MDRNNLKYKVKFTLGDPTDDGHAKTEVFNMRSNYSAKEIDNLINKFCIETGCDINEWCRDYDDSYISDEEFEKLVNHNVINPDKWNYEDGLGIFIEDTNQFVYLLEICITHVEPDFMWEYDCTDYETVSSLNGLGYGLFFT